MKQPQFATLTLEKIVGGGQALGTLEDGRKAFVWGGLPGEKVTIRITKKKSHFIEGTVSEVLEASPERIAPLDPDSYLSTSPWQIMSFDAEQHYKAALIEEAFELHDIVLPNAIDVYTDSHTSQYRNKVEFSWYSEGRDSGLVDSSSGNESTEATETLDLAFFRRGSKGKIVVEDCSLLPEPMLTLAHAVRDLLRTKHVTARQLKTLLIRCDQRGNCVWQLYVKDEIFDAISADDATRLPAQGGEVIYSDPRSPASRITKRLVQFGDIVLRDELMGTKFRYATEGFFQVNIPIYEQALRDMGTWLLADGERKMEAILEGDEGSEGRETAASRPVVDMYSGVGTIGLTIGGPNCTLIEIDEHAVREMKRNIRETHSTAKAVLAPSEKALEYIKHDMTVIVDPPRAGLHRDVIDRLLETKPPRIVYLSCNPVTQARDVALLSEAYGIRHHRGYNFFPRTPHIEHLVVLDRKYD